jgi:hypothetical protein
VFRGGEAAGVLPSRQRETARWAEPAADARCSSSSPVRVRGGRDGAAGVGGGRRGLWQEAAGQGRRWRPEVGVCWCGSRKKNMLFPKRPGAA